MRIIQTVVGLFLGALHFSTPSPAGVTLAEEDQVSVVPGGEWKRVAVVIGNENYRFHSPWLHGINDARVVAQAFEDAKFDKVILRTDSDRQGFLNALKEIQIADPVNQLGQGQTTTAKRHIGLLVVYFTGRSRSIDGKDLLLFNDSPSSHDDALQSSMVQVDELFSRVAESAGQSIFVLDTCIKQQEFRKRNGALMQLSATYGCPERDEQRTKTAYAESFVGTITQPGLPLLKALNLVESEVAIRTKNQPRPRTVGWVEIEPIVPGASPEAVRRELAAIARSGTREDPRRALVQSHP